MIGAFAFEHGGRSYTCTPETRDTAPTGTWWWFTVSHDSSRYAPFEGSPGDTQRSVRERIIAYYERLVWLRAQPTVRPERQRFSGPGKPAAPAAPAPAVQPTKK
jgi:hypothetical protein